MDFVGNARSQMSSTTTVPSSWAGTTVGTMSPARTVAQYTTWASTDRDRAATVAGDLVRLAQNGDQVAPVMLVALMGLYLRKHCCMFALDDVISEFVEEIYRFNPDRQEARASNLAGRVRQRLRRQRDRDDRLEAEIATMPPAAGDDDEFIKLLAESPLSDDDKRLIFRIRVLDERVDVVAAERGVRKSKMYQDIARVEAGLIAQLQAVA